MVVPTGSLHISATKKLTIHNFKSQTDILKACHKASAAIRWVVAQLQQTHTSLGTFRSSGWTRVEPLLPRAYTIDRSTNTKNWCKRYFLLMNQEFYWNLRRYPVDGWKLAEVYSLPQGWKNKFKPQLQKKLDAQCQAKTICTYLHIVQLKSVFKRPCHGRVHLGFNFNPSIRKIFGKIMLLPQLDLTLDPKPYRLVPSSATVIACAEKGVHQSQMMGAETALVLNKLHQLHSNNQKSWTCHDSCLTVVNCPFESFWPGYL